jgi:RNA-directed DNA polymerase
MKANINSIFNWNKINWKNIEKDVFKLQCKIFKYTQKNNKKKVHSIQILLLNSFKSKLLAVRKVTQDNKGKKIAGIDGVKEISVKQRLDLARTLKIDGLTMPIRRIYVQKKDGTMRPLGIPTIKDRAKQRLAVLALEPEWEAKFEPNSYGFRLGRSSWDAVEAIYKSINRLPKYVLHATIRECFDKIAHKALLKKLDTFPLMLKQIRGWLKAGIFEKNLFNSIETLIKENLDGTPQGGVIPPLLANIALNGIETTLKEKTLQLYGVKVCKSLTIVRYADDIVILHPKLNVIRLCKKELSKFLFTWNLTLNKAKTQISHTFIQDSLIKKRGVEYLGFYIVQLPVGKYKRKKEGRPYRTLTLPSRASVTKHITNLKSILKKTAKRELIISRLNPKIIRWGNYFRSGTSAKIFNYLDHHILKLLFSRLKQIHRKRSMKWIVQRYFKRINGYKWTFYCLGKKNEEITLIRHATISISRHIKIKGDMSIYDGNLSYWSKRLKLMPEFSELKRKLLNKQKGICPLCLGTFWYGDEMEIDHIIPIFKGGQRIFTNIQLVHKHCHHRKTSKDKLVD